MYKLNKYSDIATNLVAVDKVGLAFQGSFQLVFL